MGYADVVRAKGPSEKAADRRRRAIVLEDVGGRAIQFSKSAHVISSNATRKESHWAAASSS